MASFERKSASGALKSQSDKPKRPSVNLKRASNEVKSAEMIQRRRPISSAQPKKIKEAMATSGNKKSVNEVKENKGQTLTRGQQNGPAAYSTIRREKLLVRGKRRGYHVADLQSRRKGLTHRGHPLKREIQHLKRNPLDNPFPLTNLEEYLKERGPGVRNEANVIEDLESPNSHLAHLQKSNLMIKNQRLVFVGESPSHLVDLSLKDQRLLAKFSVHTYVSADELDDVAQQLNSDVSNCGMSLHWPANGRSSKNESLLHYAGSCFSVSRRRVGGRRRQVAYMYNSERSVSSFGSDSETVPLMTEPEPFHEYSDDLSASSVELEEQQPPSQEQGGQLTYNAYKDIHTNEACFIIKQDLSFKKSRETTCKHRSISQKYRPKSFKDLLGQKMVSESLSNAILRSKVAPVYLFHGPRGTGKTTAAKIFTCAMNCLSIEELRPCGLCKECISFNAGTNYDVKEVDAAANNEIESMRLMLKHLSLPPSMSRYKVFIMDDCHMLTAEAWNALLKSLEEPPEYVVFILITTNFEQLPRAAISRCQKFVFSRIKDADVVFRLRKLAQQEKVEIDAEALHFIAAQSDGSLRDAENMLDQMSLLGKRVTLAIVREMVGLIPEEELINLLELALSADIVGTVNSVRELMGSGVEPLALVCQLATLITDILSGKCQSASYLGMRVRKDQQDKLQQALRVLSDSEKQLRSCSDRTTWLTAAFLQFASNNACSHPSSSRGTSVTQSPTVFLDANEKETLNSDCTGRRRSWGGKEKWDSDAPLQLDCAQGQFLCENSSGPYVDNRIYPCDHSPQSCTSVDEKAVCGVPGTTSLSGRSKPSNLNPYTMDEVWQKVLHGSSNVLKQLLQGEGRLVSLSVTEAFAIVRLEFRSPEHRSMAERAKQNISKAFQVALFCPVKVEISLSPPQGQNEFLCRGANQPPRIHSEHHSKRILLDHEDGHAHEQGTMRGGSLRKSSSSSFRKMESVTSSPRCHDSEHRKSVQGHEGDARAYSRRSADASFRDLQVHKRPEETTSDALLLNANAGIADKHVKNKDERSSFEDPRFSASLRWSDTREDLEYSSDSEVDGRYAPGLLCWKGTRMKDEKAKHHVLRRRRAKFLLRLVPCGKEEDQR